MKKAIKTTNAIFPMPVLLIATYNDDNTVNVMNAAWGMMLDTNLVLLNLSKTHHTVQNIIKRKAFTISFANKDYVKEADYFGIVSGHDVNDKLSRAGLKSFKSNLINAPIIDEYPMCVECEFVEFIEDKYEVGVLGKVIRVSAEEKYFKDNKLDVDSLGILAYDPFTHGYYQIQNRVGTAFKDGLDIKKR